MQREEPAPRGRNRRRGGGLSQRNKNQEPVAELQQQQQKHLHNYALPLPISTRAVGRAVGQFMRDLSIAMYHNSSSSDDDELPESYIEEVTPNLYQVYRLFLAVFETKLGQVQFSSGSRFRGYDVRCFGAIKIYDYPKHITEIVNALGIVQYGDLTFVPVVTEEIFDANGRLVPLPQSLVYSNLRRAVVALADPETPEQYRIDFEANCPIPGAIWDERHLLMNADEIIPDNHRIEEEHVKAFLRQPAASLQGKLNNDTRGNISALVNINKMRDIRLSPRKAGQSLRDYHVGNMVDCFISDFTSFTKLTADQTKQGWDLMFGEVPKNDDHKSALHAIRDRCVSAFNLARFVDKSESVCLTLSVTTRGIGFHLGRFFLFNGEKFQLGEPNIYATYRAFLGLFEIKLKPNWLCTRIKPSEAYRSSFVRTNPNLTSTIVISVPEPINRIISAVGNVTIGQTTFVMSMASERLDENGKLIPEPQNLLVSNLRRTVEALSDPETPLHHREHFELNCPIPGAIWDNHLLTNADEIVPANYSAEDLEADILAWVACTSELKGRVEPRLTELTLNGNGVALGKRSAFVSVTMNRSTRVEPRQAGQELAGNVPMPTFQPEQWLQCHSFVSLTREEAVEGQMLMLGETPKGDKRSIYALRNPVVCGFGIVERINVYDSMIYLSRLMSR